MTTEHRQQLSDPRADRGSWWREKAKPAWQSFEWPVVGGLVGLSVLLGYVGFARLPGPARSPLDHLYLALQLFVLQSGDVARVSWELEVARFLAPAVTVYTAVKAAAVILREQWQLLRLRLMDGHVVICGLGRNDQLVKDFRRAGEQVVVIEKDEENDEIKPSRDLGAIVLVGDATDRAMLRKARVHRARHVVVICGSDGLNVEVAFQILRILRDRRAAMRRPLQCFIHVVSLELWKLFRQNPLCAETGDLAEVRHFTVYGNAARLLFRDTPLDHERVTAEDPRSVRLGIVGFGQMGERVALQAARSAHLAHGKLLEIRVVDREAGLRQRSFAHRYPQLDLVCLATFVEGDAEDPAVLTELLGWVTDPQALGFLVICFDDDSRGLACAMRLMAGLGGHHVPISVRMSDASGLATLLKASDGGGAGRTRAHPFGMVNLTCTREMVITEQLDTLARAIHERYRAQRLAQGAAPDDPSVQPWERLPDDLKDSNRHQADHIPVKLRAIGCTSSPRKAGATPVDGFTPWEQQVLARMEHARWMAERLLAGWTHGPRCAERKTSPYLVPWGQLPAEIQQYAIESTLGIPDLLAHIGETISRSSPATTP